MIRWWQNLSVSKKLYSVVGVMAILIAIELFTLYFAMSTLSAVRAFVGGEGLWSKAQKTSIFYLQKYSTTRDEKFFLLFQEQLRIPMGDHKARKALESETFDFEMAREGFLEGANHPLDIEPMIRLVRRFHDVPHLNRAIQKWRLGDALIFELIEDANRLHEEVQKGREADSNRIDAIMQSVFELDTRITNVENEFSFALGEASRWLENLLMIALILAVITVESTGLFLTITFSRGLSKALGELNAAANLVGQGDFNQRVPVRSNDELGQLAESLNRMTENLQQQVNEKENAEHASESKNLFLANMSHEIRTPLNAILGFADIMSDPHLPESERARYAAIVKRTGATLTSIINDILDISKVEAEQLEVEIKAFSLSQMLSDLKAVLEVRSSEKGIQLTFQQAGPVSDSIKSDPGRLRQILANIIGNAIKFTDRGFVGVTYEVVNDQLIFTVRDSGAGIAGEQVDRLFRPFSQGDDSVRKRFGGTGLGLLISQRLAQLLGGDVALLESHAGEGSTFRIAVSYLPVENAGSISVTAKTDKSSESAVSLKGKRILVVEDSRDNQLLAELYLTRTGADVEFANNGEEGVAKASGQNYDAVLMDIQMPVMDGYSATQELRKRGFKSPIIALTGYAMKEDQQKCLDAGCDDYVAKPFDRDALLRCVAKYVA